MYVNKKFYSVLLFIGVVGLLPATVTADPQAVHDPHRLVSNEDFQETIEARCTICHTRERVDQALAEGEDLETLLQQMIERGAILNERDQNVLGTFWGSPTTGDKQPVQK